MILSDLRNEFLRLSDLYPELRHALVVGDERWLFTDSFYQTLDHIKELVSDTFHLAIVDLATMRNDTRALSLCGWTGTLDSTRADEALRQFRALARVATELVEPIALSGRVTPKFSVAASMDVSALRPGHSIMELPANGAIVDDWIGHMFAANYAESTRFFLGNGGEPTKVDVLLLPFDSFRVSAYSLGNGGRTTPPTEARGASGPQRRLIISIPTPQVIVDGTPISLTVDQAACLKCLYDAADWLGSRAITDATGIARPDRIVAVLRDEILASHNVIETDRRIGSRIRPEWLGARAPI